ncbi:hypothetical protein RIF29_29620 [Crotalaria pallida]|uniref:Uncharacterized protein n=1 Tax=Crotalaria pallida TaxID=3830 RepID=A0AAN9EF36_CROPI
MQGEETNVFCCDQVFIKAKITGSDEMIERNDLDTTNFGKQGFVDAPLDQSKMDAADASIPAIQGERKTTHLPPTNKEQESLDSQMINDRDLFPMGPFDRNTYPNTPFPEIRMFFSVCTPQCYTAILHSRILVYRDNLLSSNNESAFD